jgi:hypothetical protein
VGLSTFGHGGQALLKIARPQAFNLFSYGHPQACIGIVVPCSLEGSPSSAQGKWRLFYNHRGEFGSLSLDLSAVNHSTGQTDSVGLVSVDDLSKQNHLACAIFADDTGQPYRCPHIGQ